MTKQEFIDRVAQRAGLQRRDAQKTRRRVPGHGHRRAQPARRDRVHGLREVHDAGSRRAPGGQPAESDREGDDSGVDRAEVLGRERAEERRSRTLDPRPTDASRAAARRPRSFRRGTPSGGGRGRAWPGRCARGARPGAGPSRPGCRRVRTAASRQCRDGPVAPARSLPSGRCRPFRGCGLRAHPSGRAAGPGVRPVGEVTSGTDCREAPFEMPAFELAHVPQLRLDRVPPIRLER